MLSAHCRHLEVFDMKWKMVAVSCLALLGAACASSGRSGLFPIVDAHGHLGASFASNTVLDVMEENGVSKQIVMARYYPGPAGNSDLPGDDDLAVKLAE